MAAKNHPHCFIITRSCTGYGLDNYLIYWHLSTGRELNVWSQLLEYVVCSIYGHFSTLVVHQKFKRR